MSRRSSFVNPPQMPASWRVSRAHARHSDFTGHSQQMALARRIRSRAAPFDPTGKNSSGSSLAHRARRTHSMRGNSTTADEDISSCILAIRRSFREIEDGANSSGRRRLGRPCGHRMARRSPFFPCCRLGIGTSTGLSGPYVVDEDVKRLLHKPLTAMFGDRSLTCEFVESHSGNCGQIGVYATVSSRPKRIGL